MEPPTNSTQTLPAKAVYKNQKRKVRNRLIYLVGAHILLIFGFVSLLCFEYLIPREWGNALYLSVLADIAFLCYVIETLAAIKFKNRKMLITSIGTLVVSLGSKTGAVILMLNDGRVVPLLLYVHVVFIIVNSCIPWCLLLLWNKLKEQKWRQTFDLYTKLNKHLMEGQIAV